MDMQGEPVGGTKGATKNTSDSGTITEPTGAITSDSLAAESAKGGGKFAENRNGGQPLGVKGANSTLATTDTSAASTLPPAPNATTRDEVWQESGAGEKYPEGAGGQPDFPGSHAGGSYAGGPTSSKQGTADGSGGAYTGGSSGGSDNTTITSSSGGGSGSSATDNTSNQRQQQQQPGQPSSGSGGQTSTDSNVDPAPSYVADVTQPSAFNTGGPKGKNLKEVGDGEQFEGESTQTAEIGSENDPGRRAEQDFERKAQSATGGTGPRQGMQEGTEAQGQYSALGGDQNA